MTRYIGICILGFSLSMGLPVAASSIGLNIIRHMTSPPEASGPPRAGSGSATWLAREVVVPPRPTLPAPPVVSDREFYDAIRAVESAGDDSAVGDCGASRGPYQCGRAAWEDACEFAGCDWDYDTYVWDRDRCEYLMAAYWDRYGAVTFEEKARCHNSGPKWREKYHLTDDYWRRVRAAKKGK